MYNFICCQNAKIQEPTRSYSGLYCYITPEGYMFIKLKKLISIFDSNKVGVSIIHINPEHGGFFLIF